MKDIENRDESFSILKIVDAVIRLLMIVSQLINDPSVLKNDQ